MRYALVQLAIASALTLIVAIAVSQERFAPTPNRDVQLRFVVIDEPSIEASCRSLLAAGNMPAEQIEQFVRPDPDNVPDIDRCVEYLIFDAMSTVPGLEISSMRAARYEFVDGRLQ